MVLTLFGGAGGTQIVGAESQKSFRPTDHYALVIEHLRKVLEDPHFAGLPLVVGVENALGHESDHIYDLIASAEGIGDRTCVLFSQNIRSGIRPSDELDYHLWVKTYMALHRGEMHFYKRFVTVGSDPGTGVKSTPDKNIKRIVVQLRNYQMIEKTSTRSARKVRFEFTGKTTGPDDLAKALILQYAARALFESPSGRRQYAIFRAKHNIRGLAALG